MTNFKTVGGVLVVDQGTTIYIIRNPTVTNISFDHSGGDIIQEFDIQIKGELESANGSIKCKFKDGEQFIDIYDYIRVTEQYGSIFNMSIDEYRKKLLAIEI